MNTLHYIHLIALSEAVELIKRIDKAYIEDGKNPHINVLSLFLGEMQQANAITDLLKLSDKRLFNNFCLKNRTANTPMGDLCHDLTNDKEITDAPNAFIVLAKLLSLREKKHLTEVVDNLIEQVFEQEAIAYHNEITSL
jgi:hypothetical protein